MRTATSRHVHRSISFRSIEEASASLLFTVYFLSKTGRLIPDFQAFQIVTSKWLLKVGSSAMLTSGWPALLSTVYFARTWSQKYPNHSHFTFPTGKWLLKMIVQAQCSMQNLPCAPPCPLNACPEPKGTCLYARAHSSSQEAAK
jgi:hypothetical protein